MKPLYEVYKIIWTLFGEILDRHFFLRRYRQFVRYLVGFLVHCRGSLCELCTCILSFFAWPVLLRRRIVFAREICNFLNVNRQNIRSISVEPFLEPSNMALLQSQSGCCGGRHLALVPNINENKFTNERFGTILARRIRLSIHSFRDNCNGRTCRQRFDRLGDHRSACSRAGRLTKRDVPVETMWARMWRDGGAHIQTNVFLRDMDLVGINGE